MLLAMYDVSGIQNFIFSSPKLKENIGASLLVQKIFEEDLIDVLLKHGAPEETTQKWMELDNFKMQDDPQCPAEVIYIGGGNTLVTFRDEKIFSDVTEDLAFRVYEKSQGLLKVSSAFSEISENKPLKDIMKELYRKLRQKKAKIFQSMPLNGFGLNRTSTLDGFVIPESSQEEDKKDEVKSVVVNAKINTFKKFGDEYEERLELKSIEKKLFWPKEFDEINPDESKRYLAIVHIDGNSMGKTIQEILGKENDFNKALLLMRDFSKKISEHYKNAMRQTIEFLIEKMDTHEFKAFDKGKETLKEYLRIEKNFPLRVIILNGDDVTFVTHGRLGIPLAKKFLEEVEKNSIELSVGDSKEKVSMSACAGVAIVKSHFPFYRAYELSEELISNAKKKAKELAPNGPVPSMLDVHVVQTGITTDLEAIREKYYIRNDDILIARPWLMSDADYQQNDVIKFSDFLTVFNHFAGENSDKKWPRSRLKAMRDALFNSEEEFEFVKLSAESRSYQLPQNADKKIIFDVVELLDMFIDL